MKNELEQGLKARAIPETPLLRLSVGLGLAGGLLVVLQARFLADAAAAVVMEGKDLQAVMPLLWGILCVVIVRAILARSAEIAALKAALRVKERLREELFRHLQKVGPLPLRGMESGALAAAVVEGVEAIEAYFSRYLPHLALTALIPLSILVFVFPADWISALILLFTAPFIPLFMVLIGSSAEKLNRRQWRRLARMSGHFLDILQGLTTLKIFNAEKREAALMARISDEYRLTTMSVLRIAFLSALALEFFATVSTAVIAVTIGFRLLGGKMHFFPGFFVLLLAPEFYLPLRTMGNYYHARMQALGAAERIMEILALPLPEEPVGGTIPDLSFGVTIAFDNVRFSYEGERHALDGASFSAEAGHVTALVGPSGAGKSTVLSLMLGFIRPQEGTISVNGADLSLIPREEWLKSVAWVPQRPRLFHGSVADNIRLGRQEATLDEIRVAAKAACAEEFILELAQGYDTVVGEGGQGLSGGQIQRLALARAFLKDAPLLVLDEATAGLDVKSEALVQEALERLAQGRTVIIAAHRLATVKKADRIVVLDQGRVAESGSHDALSAGEGLYARLVSAYRGEGA